MQNQYKMNRILTLGVLFYLLFGTYRTACASQSLPTYDLGETVVTATKTKLEEKKVPMSTEVITQEEMKEKGAYNVRDALKLVNGLDVQEAAMVGNNVSLRGMGTNATLILVDGRRLASEDSGQTMNVYELNRMNIHSVDRIEIVRGSGSALYGSDAMGGVINIITKKNQKAGGYVGTDLGGREQSVYGGVSTGNVGKFNMNVDFNVRDVRKIDTDGSTNMYGPRRYLNFNSTYRFDDHSGIEAGVSFLKEQYRTFTSGTPDSTTWYDNNRQDYHVKYFGFDDKNDYEFQVYYDRLGKESRTSRGGNWTGFDHAKYETTVTEAKNTYRPNEDHAITFGGEYRHQKVGGTRLGTIEGHNRVENYLGLSSIYSEQSMDSYAAYLQDEWQLTEKLFFVPSVRWDHFDSFGAQLSPRAGLTYEFSDAARVKLNYGLGYRAPTIFELYSRMEHNFGRFSYQVWGNDALEPEKSRTFDIGIEAEKGKSSGKLSYFHNKIDNLIDTQLIGRFGSTTRYQYVNVNKVEMNGIEGEYNYRFDDHWSARATYTYLDAKNSETNTRLTGRARNNGIVELTYLSGKEKPWSATLYNTWYRDYLSGEGKNYTYSTTNFVVTKDLNRNTHLYAGVDNIFDKQFPDTDAYSINGRTWRAGVEFTF